MYALLAAYVQWSEKKKRKAKDENGKMEKELKKSNDNNNS